MLLKIISSVDCMFISFVVFFEVLIVENLMPLANFCGFSEKQQGNKADDAWSPGTFQSSKFAHWFLEYGMSVSRLLHDIACAL